MQLSDCTGSPASSEQGRTSLPGPSGQCPGGQHLLPSCLPSSFPSKMRLSWAAALPAALFAPFPSLWRPALDWALPASCEEGWGRRDHRLSQAARGPSAHCQPCAHRQSSHTVCLLPPQEPHLVWEHWIELHKECTAHARCTRLVHALMCAHVTYTLCSGSQRCIHGWLWTDSFLLYLSFSYL